MSENILTIEADRFEELVLKADGPVVVDFFSTECPPCEALANKYERMAGIYGGDVVFLKIFRQGNRELADRLGVKSSPTVLFYESGQEIGRRLTGGVRSSALQAQLDAMVGPERAEELHARVVPSVLSCDVLILGAGPAGLTAGIYAAQAKLETVVVDRGLAGGNVAITHLVSNYPGFVEPQPGWALAHAMREQAVRAGVRFREAVDVTDVDLAGHKVVLDGHETIKARKIVLATGTSPRPLGVENELEYTGKGISYCATCDAKYYEGKHVVVIGGGNSAVEESLFLSKFASRITIVHQFAELQANKEAQQKAFADPKIEFVFETEPRVFVPHEGGIGGVEVEDLKTGERRILECDGVFIFAGMQPNLDPFDKSLKLDDSGYLVVDEDLHTSVPDVYAAGDIRGKRYRQLTTAVADGTMAAMSLQRELGA